MPARIHILQWVIQHIAVSVKALWIGRIGNNTIRADKPPYYGIVVSRIVEVQPGIVKPLAGKEAVRGEVFPDYFGTLQTGSILPRCLSGFQRCQSSGRCRSGGLSGYPVIEIRPVEAGLRRFALEHEWPPKNEFLIGIKLLAIERNPEIDYSALIIAELDIHSISATHRKKAK